MPATLISLSPHDVAERLRHGRTILIDIREADEFARCHIADAVSRPLSTLPSRASAQPPGTDIVFTCKSGLRTATNATRLTTHVGDQAFVLAGGIDGWVATGLPVIKNTGAPLEMMRQVQIAAGVLVLVGIGLGWLVTPAFFLVAGFVGAGLTFAGISGFCGMAKLLALMPWNRSAV